jgi:hypothetical protein
LNRHLKKFFFYFLGRYFYAIGSYKKATYYFSKSIRFRFFFIDIQERYKKAILKSNLKGTYIIKGGIGDILQHLPFVLDNKKLRYIILTYFRDAPDFFSELGVTNCKFIYYCDRYEYSKFNRLLNSQKNTYPCPRDIFFSSEPFIGIKEKFLKSNRKLIGLHFNASQINLIHTIPKEVQKGLIKMLIRNQFNVIVFSSNQEYKNMDKIKSKFVRYSHDINLIKNLAKVSACNLFIGCDSAFKTMSSMLKIPTIVVYPNIKMSSFGQRMFFEPYINRKILSIYRYRKDTKQEINETLSLLKEKITVLLGSSEYQDRK